MGAADGEHPCYCRMPCLRLPGAFDAPACGRNDLLKAEGQ